MEAGGAPTPTIKSSIPMAVAPHRPWWQTNGFDLNGKAAGEVRTSYLNNNDLGSGRDMHFLQHTDGSVSAYVTNYADPGHFNQNPSYADSALAQDPARRSATVCMEWSPVEGQDQTQRIVKFFVFSGNGFGALATRQEGADLDGNGIKFVPDLCITCHGGTYSDPASPSFSDLLAMHARFREFDLSTFKFPGGRNVPNAAERAAFKQQNLIVRGNLADNISTPGIKDLVNGWYGIDNFMDPHPSFTGQYTRWIPTAWDDQTSPSNVNQSTAYLYRNVVAKSCRTCHVAFDSHDPNFGFDWTTFAQFNFWKSSIMASSPSSLVFGNNPSMPHSQITFRNFWSSRNPSSEEVLGNFAGWQ